MLDEDISNYPGGACSHRWHRQRTNRRSYYGHALHDADRSSRGGCRDHRSRQAGKDGFAPLAFLIDRVNGAERSSPFDGRFVFIVPNYGLGRSKPFVWFIRKVLLSLPLTLRFTDYTTTSLLSLFFERCILEPGL